MQRSHGLHSHWNTAALFGRPPKQTLLVTIPQYVVNITFCTGSSYARGAILRCASPTFKPCHCDPQDPQALRASSRRVSQECGLKDLEAPHDNIRTVRARSFLAPASHSNAINVNTIQKSLWRKRRHRNNQVEAN